MAATGATPISLYYSSTTTNVPTAGNLVAGELALNTADGKLFYKDSSNVVQVIGTKGGVGTSSTTQVLYNSSGLVVGSANLTFNGTTLTTANDASISGITVGKGGGSLASNTAFGGSALNANTTGTDNTAIGYRAGIATTTGISITVVGSGALFTNTTGQNLTAIGVNSLVFNTTGSYNTALGSQSLFSNTTASNNTAVGYQAAYSNVTGTPITAVGAQALYSNTGSYSTALGWSALKANTSGSENTAVGHAALYVNTTGGSNVAFGGESLVTNTTGSYNTAIGTSALGLNTTASNNTAVGYQAGYANTTGTFNVFLGTASGIANTTGYSNCLIGYNAGSTVTTGAALTLIGTSALPAAATDTNEIAIGNGATGKGSNTGFINPNGGGVYQGNNSTLWSITSDARLKKNIVNNNTGLDKITAIQVRNFEYRLPEEITEVSPDQAIQKTGVQLGAIAQELQQILPECAKQESTGIYTVDADPLIWYLVNAVKELNAKITALENK